MIGPRLLPLTGWMGLCVLLCGCEKGERSGKMSDSAVVTSSDSGTTALTSTTPTSPTTPTTPTTPPCDLQPCVVEGVLTEDVTLTANASWLLRGVVVVGEEGSPATLTIEPGTRVHGERETGGRLVVSRGSTLIAAGTEDAPIVFTSDQPVGDRAAGDWGGLTVLGSAPTNRCASDMVPKTDPCEVVTEEGTYGGDSLDGGAGVLRFVQIAFAGQGETPRAGLALWAVGSGTELDAVQVHRSAGDGVHFVGGTVDARRLLVTLPGDDGIDWEAGWTGRAQFIAVQQSSLGALTSPFRDQQAIEGDNLIEVNEAVPISAPVLANLTIAGSSEEGRCVHLREGTRATILGLLAVGCGSGGLDVDHDVTLAHALDGSLAIRSSTLDVLNPFVVDPIQGVLGFDVEAWFLGQDGNVVAEVTLESGIDPVAPDFRAVGEAGSVTLPDDLFFEAASERGAMPGGVDWSVGWSATPES